MWDIIVCFQESSVSLVAESDGSISRIIAEMFATITAVHDANDSQAEMIAMQTLFDAHHPVIGT